MSAGVELRVGAFRVRAARAPSGARGTIAVRILADAGAETGGDLSWELSGDGDLRLELVEGGAVRTALWSSRGERGDSGEALWSLRCRAGADAGRDWSGVAAGGSGAGSGGPAGAAKRKRVKAQMPGKILKVLVVEGDPVARGQALLVMEAMKMENEIRAEGPGRVGKVTAVPGATVETGAELLIIEPEA